MVMKKEKAGRKRAVVLLESAVEVEMLATTTAMVLAVSAFVLPATEL
jgi:hypothetical protein